MAVFETPIVEPVAENFKKTIKEVKEQEGGTVSEENNVQVNYDNYDLIVLDKFYDEVINKGNEVYLYNFLSSELAIIGNTLYARNAYKFKKKEYQKKVSELKKTLKTTASK